MEASAPYHLRAMDSPDAVGYAGIRGAGPYLTIFVRFAAGVVSEASYETYSCPNAIACGSWVTRWMEGKGPEMLYRLEADDLIRILGGLPLGKEHCAHLPVTALRDLLSNWPKPVGLDEGEGS